MKGTKAQRANGSGRGSHSEQAQMHLPRGGGLAQGLPAGQEQRCNSGLVSLAQKMSLSPSCEVWDERIFWNQDLAESKSSDSARNSGT